MSDFKKLTTNSCVTAVFLSTCLMPAMAQANIKATTSDNVKTMADKTLETSQMAIDVTKEWAGETKEGADALLKRLAIGEKIDNLQDKTLPVGHKIKAVANPKNIPGVDAAVWADKNTSFPAMLFLMVATGVLLVMAKAGPSSLSGGRH